MPPSNCFETGQEITNSIFCAGPSGLRQQMDVWFSIEEEPPAERHERELKHLRILCTRFSEGASGELLPS